MKIEEHFKSLQELNLVAVTVILKLRFFVLGKLA